MSAPIKTLVLVAGLAVSACASSGQGTAHMREARYMTDVPTASAIVRDALEAYPIIERGNGRFETRWLRGRHGVYRFSVHVDGPGDGPFTISVDTAMRDPRAGVETVDHPPRDIARERDRIVTDIYTALKPLEVQPVPVLDNSRNVSVR